jgi:hypothetical protein
LNKANIAIIGIGALIFAVALALLLAGGPQAVMGSVMGGGAASADLDTAEVRPTDQGLFRVTYTSLVEPVPVNQLHTWTIHVETPGGTPIEQAEIVVGGGMPQHAHGLPTKPQVTQDLGGGDYTVEGLRFHMPGWWEVTFQITAGGQSDSVTFNLVLQ